MESFDINCCICGIIENLTPDTVKQSKWRSVDVVSLEDCVAFFCDKCWPGSKDAALNMLDTMHLEVK